MNECTGIRRKKIVQKHLPMRKFTRPDATAAEQNQVLIKIISFNHITSSKNLIAVYAW